jgi:hypothetical protein
MTGRNAPCPCGSGLKYKKCCRNLTQAGGPQPAGMQETMNDLGKVLAEQQFGSIEEANAFLARHTQKRNRAPKDDFCGLSSEQMHRFLDFPLETPELASFADCLDTVPEAPVMDLFQLLIDGVGEKGLKPTATGNLPRDFCRQTARLYWGEERYLEISRRGELRTETAFFDLHVTRLVAELAGLLRKYQGKFILGRDCRQILARQGMAGLYPKLLATFCRQYNWAYGDGYPDYPIIQQSFLFTLRLLARYGGEWRSNQFYADALLRAFPIVLREVPESMCYEPPEQHVGHCYSLRCLKHFAEFFGLVEIERNPDDRYATEFRLRKRPLLDQFVRFYV